MADFAGTPDADTWFGTGNGDTAHGGGGDDRLFGNDGDDSLYGEDGNDYLHGGAGNDLVDGGDGNDILGIRANTFPPQDLSAGDQFFGGSGFDTLYIEGERFELYDLTGIAIAADIEKIQTFNAFVTLPHARFASFSQMEGDFRPIGSGTLDLTGGRFLSGSLFLDSGNDVVSLAGNVGPHFGLSGGGGDDQLIGSESVDILNGDEGNDRLEGRGSDDSLDGGNGNDIVLGGNGNDLIFDGAGDDILEGGAGDDQFLLNLSAGFSAADQLSGGAGVDTLSISTPYLATVDFSTFAIADDFERLSAGLARIVATAERVSHFQYFQALALKLTTAGNFTGSVDFKVTEIELSDFGNGIDMSAAEPGGNLHVIGGAGADTVIGTAFLDDLEGGGGNDVIHAGSGADTIGGGGGMDWIDGGVGDDTLRIEQGEAVSAGDRFTGGTGTDRLFIGGPTYNGPIHIADLGGALIDADIERLEGDNYSGVRATVAQLAGFSRIYLQEIHLLSGGAIDFTGKETRGYLYLNDVGNQVTVSAAGFYAVFGGAGHDIVFGAEHGDEIRGNGGDDALYGGGESDFLTGGDGNDILGGGGIGAIGVNALWGGAGNDIYIVDSPDMIFETAGQGFDTVLASISFALESGDEIEILSAVNLAATTAIALTGNELAQQVIGNAGNNLLDGGGGADTMTGRAGDDVYVVDVATDIVVESPGQGVDEIRTALATYSLVALPNVENLTGTSGSGQTLTGNDGANALVGATGGDRLAGGGGDDRLAGGGGRDIALGGDGADIFAFTSLTDSRLRAFRSDGKKYLPEFLGDFVAGTDRIDLSAIDAVAGTAANDAFSFIGTAGFSGVAGQLRYEAGPGRARIFGDVDGDGHEDFEIFVTAPSLTAADFVL